MTDNVIPIRKTDRYKLSKGRVEANGEVTETDQLGFAYIRPGSKMFRLKLWMLPHEQYFLAPDENNPKKYIVLSIDEYQLPNHETRTHWNKIGTGELHGNFILLQFHLLKEDIFLCLYPAKGEESHAA